MFTVKTVAVLGAGIMGRSIAQLFALAGFDTHLYDIKVEILEQAKQMICENLTLLTEESLIIGSDKQQALQRITWTTDLEEAVQDVQFIIEAVPEILELKLNLFKQIEQFTSSDTIIASNTSTIMLSQMMEGIQEQDRFIITHFFNPANFVPLVEVVKNDQTSNEVINTTLNLMTRIGKTPVLLKKEIPGFIANRLQAAVVREAFHLLNEGVAEAKDIDTAITSGPGFRWAFIGPLETADFGGLDTWKRVMENLAPELDKTENAPQVLTNLVDKGDLGTKSGQGIYSYIDKNVSEKIKERDRNFIELLKLKGL
jgi:3-hydroxybutyryl-CoA dehydrogenase